MQQTEQPYLEPWMRGTHGELDPLRRAVIHALELTLETVQRSVPLNGEQLFARPYGIPSVAFHLRHMARSLDRLLTYAEGTMLNETQLRALSTEHEVEYEAAPVYDEFYAGLERAMERARAIAPEDYAAERGIGRKRLPTTVAGLLIHCAEHTQRHAGQAVTTAAIVRGTGAEGTA